MTHTPDRRFTVHLLFVLIFLAGGFLQAGDDAVQVNLVAKDPNAAFDPKGVSLYLKAAGDPEHSKTKIDAYPVTCKGNQISFAVPYADLPLEVSVIVHRTSQHPYEANARFTVEVPGEAHKVLSVPFAARKIGVVDQAVQVVDNTTKQPIAGLQVTVFSYRNKPSDDTTHSQGIDPVKDAPNGSASNATTSAEGLIHIPMWSDYSYSVDFGTEEFTESSSNITANPGKLIVLLKTRIQPQAVCNVMLRQGETMARPPREFSNAVVDLYRKDKNAYVGFYVATYPQWEFKVFDLPPGEYYFATDNAYPNMREWKIDSGGNLTIVAAAKAGASQQIALIPRRKFKMTLAVVETATGAPVPEVQLSPGSARWASVPKLTTAADGTADCGDVFEGTYEIDCVVDRQGTVGHAILEHSKDETITIKVDTTAARKAQRDDKTRETALSFVQEFYLSLVNDDQESASATTAVSGAEMAKLSRDIVALKEFGGSKDEAELTESPLEKTLMEMLFVATKQNPYFTLTTVDLDVRRAGLHAYWCSSTTMPAVPTEVVAAYAAMDNDPYKKAAQAFREWQRSQLAAWPEWRRKRMEAMDRICDLLELVSEEAHSEVMPEKQKAAWGTVILQVQTELEAKWDLLTGENVPELPFDKESVVEPFWAYYQQAQRSNPCFAKMDTHLPKSKFLVMYHDYVKKGRATPEQEALDTLVQFLLAKSKSDSGTH